MIYQQNIQDLPENVGKNFLLLQAPTEIIPEIWNVSNFFPDATSTYLQEYLPLPKVNFWLLTADNAGALTVL